MNNKTAWIALSGEPVTLCYRYWDGDVHLALCKVADGSFEQLRAGVLFGRDDMLTLAHKLLEEEEYESRHHPTD